MVESIPNIQFFGLSPFEHPDPELTIALSHAGAYGIVDLGRNVREATRALRRIAQGVQGPFGIRIHSECPLTSKDLPDQVTVVMVGFEDRERPFEGRFKIVEVTSLKQAEQAREAGADGLVAKGTECGGLVGDTSTFILFQQLVAAQVDGPIWLRGGLGINTAAACIASGATGVIFDDQLALLQEASTEPGIAKAIRAMDGSETRLQGGFRVYDRPDVQARFGHADRAETVRRLLGGEGLSSQLLPVGQAAALAQGLAERHRTVAGFLSAFQAAIHGHPETAQRLNILGPGNALAQDLGTQYPILQGPMTRVSDQAAFARAVADNGGLPFLALSLMAGPQVSELVAETADLMGHKPWGVGILGFVPQALRTAQLEAVGAHQPPFAIIAGGRPAQAKALEAEGTVAYLHVPSPGLLDLFLKDGAKRFIFEGRECGGHVGPRSSFVLWETQIERLLAWQDLDGMSLIFAGGIHDAVSAAVISVMAAPLAARGARIGVLMGTAYLFTQEAVETGAIVAAYQEAACQGTETVLLETAPGHATRCLKTPYVDAFHAERERLKAEGADPKAIWAALEQLNVGRLRVASKGLTRPRGDGPKKPLETVSTAEQHTDGMYMIGQVTTMRDAVLPMAALHEEVAVGSNKLIERVVNDMTNLHPPQTRERGKATGSKVAIIGMACIYPDAPNVDQFWANIVAGHNAITEVPQERWDPNVYYDPDSQDGHKTPSKWGGFLDPIVFDPLEYGIPPKSLESIEPIQLLSLQVARDALADAGYSERPFNRAQTSVIFGAEAGTELAGAYGFRAVYPQLVGEIPDALQARLPALTEDSFPGVLANVIAGRIANRLDLGGVNYTVDAACASSLAAVDLGLKELALGTSDMVLCGGADLHNSINDYLLFSSVHALSRTGQCRSFDHKADGIVLGEGVAVIVLKRYEDAQRDGDRIYALIDGLGGSSDGRSLGLTAPRSDGQVQALARAYGASEVSPKHVGLLEAHGTGTVVGDKTELQTVERVFKAAGGGIGQCALGSVKTNIGHTKCAAGMAGVIKVALSLHRRVLPATLNIETPNPAYDQATSPFTLSNYSRPWMQKQRHGGVSAFGFGGTNFHVVLSSEGAQQPSVQNVWPAELFFFRGTTDTSARETMVQLREHLAVNPHDSLADLAYTISGINPEAPIQFSCIAGDRDTLLTRLTACLDGQAVPKDTYARNATTGDIAFLMPGQGSQRPGMMAGLFTAFPELHEYLALGEQWLDTLFPATAFTPSENAEQKAAITDTRVAQPTLGVVDLATARLLGRFGIEPDMVAGHSYGELVGLCLAGAISDDDLIKLSQFRGQAIIDAATGDPGTMAAVIAPAHDVMAALDTIPDVVIANINAPNQTVVSGGTDAMKAAISALAESGLKARQIPVACAFHSPIVAKASETLSEFLADISIHPTTIPVWSNTTAQPHEADPSLVRQTIAQHVAKPVRFVEQIEGMYAAGARTFVEVGPGSVLTGLVNRILDRKPVNLITISPNGKGELVDCLRAVGQLAAIGVEIDSAALFAGRRVNKVELSRTSRLSAVTWMVNGHMAWPASGAGPTAIQPLGQQEVLMASSPPKAQSEQTTVVLEYLRNMRQTVMDQRDVMLGYLGTAPPLRVTQHQAPIAVTRVQEEALTVPAEPVAAVVEAPEESVQEILIGLVSERTGYPPEMLDLDLDLEAALSIDSIKRIEILGALGESLGLSGADGGAIESLVEELASVKTLRGILEWLEAQETSDTDKPKPIPPVTDVDGSETGSLPTVNAGHDLERYVFRVRPAPAISFNGLTVAGKYFAITADGHGVSDHLVQLLEQNGAKADIVTLDQAQWPFDGLIHLCTLRSDETQVDLSRVFNTIQQALIGGTFWLLGASGLGGGFGRRENGYIPPTGTGLSGMLKSAAAEWPQARIRTVDLNTDEDPKSLAQAVFNELLADDGLLEVGYLDGERRILSAEVANHEKSSQAILPLDEDAVVLVTGGARGITAAAAIAMAKRARCRFELVGRTPLDEAPEDPELSQAADAPALRRLLIQKSQAPDIAEIESECARVLSQRAIRATLAAIENAGGRAHYHAVDVRNDEAMSGLVAHIYDTCGRIDGVIHGAGVIEDKLLRHKSVESFSRVYETKVRGAQTLAKHLRDDVQFVVFFSSVSGAFGNRGQVDYAAANDALDKLALSLNETLPGRVVSINWGPWGGTGMVSTELESEYERRGISLIGMPVGIEAFMHELDRGAPEDAQVLLMCADLEQMMGAND